MSGQPVPMLPTYPEVRCDLCRHKYTIPSEKREGLVTGHCPQCGYERFSTKLVGDVPAYRLHVTQVGE